MPTILWLVNSHPCPVLPCRSGFQWYGQRCSQHPSVVPGSQTFALHEAGCRWVGQEGVCPPCVPCGLQGQKTAVPGRVRLLSVSLKWLQPPGAACFGLQRPPCLKAEIFESESFSHCIRKISTCCLIKF